MFENERGATLVAVFVTTAGPRTYAGRCDLHRVDTTVIVLIVGGLVCGVSGVYSIDTVDYFVTVVVSTKRERV